MGKLSRVLVSIIVVLILLSLSTFTVDQREYALVFRLGEIVSVKKDPGLYFKTPIIENVRFFDKRILTYESEQPDRFITSEKKNVLVDSYIKWRIMDPSKYYVSVNGDERQAERRITQTVNDGLRAEFGKRTIQEVVSGQRSEIMGILQERADRESRLIGVEILDVRLRRVDLPEEVSQSVYQRMNAERKSVANELRSQGFADSEKIRAVAEKERDIIITEAYKNAQKIKGEGDATAAKIYAEAFSKDRNFYDFFRSLEAYRKSFKGKDDILILDPNSDFFKFLKSPDSK
ncbi:MAG: protease modulator HflC [Nitrosomonadales bacterium]|jgi:membrane protease subunit HflC|nr:protease modulator HflC [Nitrosomonadales bacterium]MBT3918083.1 protease modulator HflC [Nitrosomonadales bacterium]MBT4183454.1 protease modulator HflC [Nitrosomonadales bacterium]MBT4570688.1 protease modulator HflC [Nitrosomonadales bacterium]MBT4759457.1 protease modulator HflC [Nitrosomonadales bacterium]